PDFRIRMLHAFADERTRFGPPGADEKGKRHRIDPGILLCRSEDRDRVPIPDPQLEETAGGTLADPALGVPERAREIASDRRGIPFGSLPQRVGGGAPQ